MFHSRLQQLDTQSLTRRLHTLGSATGPTIQLAGRTVILLASNDYLGLATHPDVIQAAIQATAQYGTGAGAARLVCGTLPPHTELEQALATFKRTSAALLYGSGYLANLGVIPSLITRGGQIFADRLCHASLIDGMRLSRARTLVFPHNDLEQASRLLAQHAGAGVCFLVVESLFSMDGDFAPLAEYAALCRSAGAVLVVDEAHAVGIYGDSGSGWLEASGVSARDCVSINTAGKALGVGGAFVCGPSWAVEYLVQRARPFIYSTAPPPALADALDASLSLVAGEPERRVRLRRLAGHLRARLKEAGIQGAEGSSQIVPIVIGGNERAVAIAGALQQAGFDVRAIRPPSVPRGTARLRASVNAGLSESHLDQFVTTLASALKEADTCSAASS